MFFTLNHPTKLVQGLVMPWVRPACTKRHLDEFQTWGISCWNPGKIIRKDVENPWFPRENDLDMAGLWLCESWRVMIGFGTLSIQLRLYILYPNFDMSTFSFSEAKTVFEGYLYNQSRPVWTPNLVLMWIQYSTDWFKGTFTGLTPIFHGKIQVSQLRFPLNQSDICYTTLDTSNLFNHPGSNVADWGSIRCSWWIEAFWRSPSTLTT